MRRLLGCVLLATALLAACSSAPKPGNRSSKNAEAQPPIVAVSGPAPKLPVTVTSTDGREIVVKDVDRILPLWGNLAEIVFGLGLGDKVVGRDITATIPEMQKLPLVTIAHDVSAEGVLSLHPSIVLATPDTGPSSAIEQLMSAGVTVIRFKDPTDIGEVIPHIKGVAAALGVTERGETLAARTQSEMAAVQALVPRNQTQLKVAFLYIRGHAGVYLIGGPKSGADSMIIAAGAADAGTAMGLTRSFNPITSEAMAKAAPDVILMTSSGLESVGGIDGLVKVSGIAETPAGKNRRVVTLEDGLLYSFGPRTPIALKQLINKLYGTGD